MKKNLLVFLLLAFTFVSCSSLGKADSKTNAAEKEAETWMEAESLNKAYESYFDYIGFAVPYDLLNRIQIQEGLAHQAGCVTPENEFKPNSLLGWGKPTQLKDFTAEDGKSYKVPAQLAGTSSLKNYLNFALVNDVKLRGHVLVWHSQTQAWFFRENFDAKGKLVDKETMRARQEWYIKSVLEFVKEWEDRYADGKRVIITWDVVNEAISDGGDYLRNTGSDWYSIYKDDSFIIDAFRFANRYAPADLKLAYNDYGCYSQQKSQKIVKLIKKIQSSPGTRIDVLGMQSHISMSNPTTYLYELALKEFFKLGIDVQVTELDIGSGNSVCTPALLADKYAQFFELFLKYRKVPGKNGISGVTLWGILDERSWISKNGTEHPLLFEQDFRCKPAFYSVLETAKKEAEN
ncbi:MAG: endo-1,4-beta-xylanase [Treponema sp.]|nr:endo-1,4-beta-xylanase [Treponema sp.]